MRYSRGRSLMKPCPFCDEEVQPAATRCTHCRASLVDVVVPAASAGVAACAALSAAFERRPGLPGTAIADDGARRQKRRRVLYRGCPSWRAYFFHYVAGVALALVGPALGYQFALTGGLSWSARTASVLGPSALAAVWLFAIGVYRRSKVVQISDHNIERESGVLARKISVLDFSRCLDVAYRQSLAERTLRIAHLDVFLADRRGPPVRITGVPASKYLFERIRGAMVARGLR